VEAARPLLLAGALALAALAAPLAAPLAGADGAATSPATGTPGPEPVPARQRELMTLLRQDCGSCHGMRLTGGLGPALTRDALKDKPRELVAATIVHGRPGTPMPPWGRFLSDADASWLAARLIDGVSDAPQ